jgi:hypothetical protein
VVLVRERGELREGPRTPPARSESDPFQVADDVTSQWRAVRPAPALPGPGPPKSPYVRIGVVLALLFRVLLNGAAFSIKTLSLRAYSYLYLACGLLPDWES